MDPGVMTSRFQVVETEQIGFVPIEGIFKILIVDLLLDGF